MDFSNPPDQYWHCMVTLAGDKNFSVVNDLSFDELQKTIVRPWTSGKPFTVGGTIIRSHESVKQIKISHTDMSKQFYADRHYERMRSSGIADMATNRSLLPISEGTDATFDLLFSGPISQPVEPDEHLVVRLCSRIAQSARILAFRSRKDKKAFEIKDEYDVQDLLHSMIRGYLKYSVQEDPLPKVSGAKSGRADISIEEIGVLIEIKYVRGPEDQKRLFGEFSQDLLLYAKWPHLKTLIFLIYNSADLRDAEAFEKLTSEQEVSGKKFKLKVVLA